MKRFIINLILFLVLVSSFSFGVAGVFARVAPVAPAGATAPQDDLVTGPLAYSTAGAALNEWNRQLQKGAADAVGNGLNDLQKWTLEVVAPFIANFILQIASWILWAAVALFNITLNYSLNFGKFLEGMPIVDVGWKIFRDVANIGFIFILLYIAISTIVQASTANTQKLLVRVVMIALVLNFSLFFTRVIIDSGNILALSVYQKMGVAGKTTTNDPFYDAKNGADQGISAAVIKGLGLTTIWYSKDKDPSDLHGRELVKALAGNATTGINILIIAVGGSIFILVTAFVFLVGAILFLIRTVTLIYLMILSPLAFAANILPQTQKHFSTWFSSLINQTFFPAIFLLLMLMVLQVITGRTTEMSFGQVLKGNSDAIGTLFNFVILIGLMLGALVISQKMGAHGGDFARNVAGKAAFGSGAFLTRQTIGRGVKALQESDSVKKLAASKGFGGLVGRRLEKGLKTASEGSMDMRGIGGFGKLAGGLGEVGGKGGYAKSFKDSQKGWEDQQKRVKSQTIKEQMNINALEAEKKIATDVQAGSLISSKEKAEEEINRGDLKTKKETAEQTIISLEETKKAALGPLNKQEIDIRNQIAAKYKEWSELSNDEEKTEKMKEIEAIQSGAEKIKVQKAQLEMDVDAKIGAQQDTISAYNKQENIIKEAKSSLGLINSDYDAKASNSVNAKVVAKMRSDANSHAAIEYAKNTKDVEGISLENKSASKIQEHIDMNIVSKIKEVKRKGESRGGSYATASDLDKWFASKGMTTSKMAMVQDIIKEKGKSKKDKAFEAFAEVYEKEFGTGDKKEKKESASSDKKEDKKEDKK